MAERIIECREVWKSFRTYTRKNGVKGIFQNFFNRQYTEFIALKNISLHLSKGEFVGLIGTNGAGKTTFVKCLTGIIPVSRGQSLLFGSDSFHLRDDEKKRMSLVMGQRSQLWWDLPAIDSFKLLREIYDIPAPDFEYKISAYTERLEVRDCLKIQLRQLSLGQRMKMEIIGAFLHNPEVVFLDEPTIGLDLVSQQTIRHFLLEINRHQKVTILLTSHNMEDIEQTCQRLIILESGEVLFDGDLVHLQRQLVGKRSITVHLDPSLPGWQDSWSAGLAQYQGELIHQMPTQLSFVVDAQSVNAFIKFLLERLEIRDLTIERESLEHLIMEIFKNKKFQPKEKAIVSEKREEFV